MGHSVHKNENHEEGCRAAACAEIWRIPSRSGFVYAVFSVLRLAALGRR